MSQIVVHPEVRTVTKADIVERDPSLDVVQPPAAEVGDVLAAQSGRKVFISANRTWNDDYVDALSAGDWVTTSGSGYETYPLDEFDERGVTFTNTNGIHYRPIGEHAFGLLFAVSRQLFTFHDLQQEREWGRLQYPLTDYGGEVCCIVGLGEIGEPLAEQAQTFGMTVRGVKRSVEGYDGAADAVYPPEELLTALEGARAVIICVPLTEETHGLIDAAAFEACADDAVLFHVARGPVVDTDDLLHALDTNELRAAALDVFDEEPLPKDSPLWNRDDVHITPHCAGHTDKYAGRFLDIFLERYAQWERGEQIADRLV